MNQNQKLPSLDGWRAVSIGLLLLGHCFYTRHFPASLAGSLHGLGIMGVRFFFVISGFLITWLLLREREQSGRISLKNFYIRRVLRIFPVVYVYLAVLGIFTAYRQAASAWVANLTFTSNYIPVGFGTSHLWSLAVEEQFYLLWPLLLLLLPVAGKRILLALVVPITVAPLIRSLPIREWLPPGFPNLFGYWSFVSEFDLLAYGCLAAILFTRYRVWLEVFFRSHPVLVPSAAGALIVVPAIFHNHVGGFYESCQGAGFAVCLLQSILFPDQFPFRPLQWAWVRWLGVLSYSIYIWQMMFCGTAEEVFGRREAWWTDFPWWLLMSLLAAMASYYLLERPLFSLRQRFRA